MNRPRKSVRIKNAKLTPQEDKKGIEVFICAPPWFDEKKIYKIANAPERTARLEFPGSDLNFMSRVLYAESSGSFHIPDKNVRDIEKEAILNVNHFRLNRPGYPVPSYIAKDFYGVCTADGQFASVSPGNKKFTSSVIKVAEELNEKECADLCEAIEAVSLFIKNGPNAVYEFDNFRGYLPNGVGEHIGRSRFWLSKGGKKLRTNIP